MYIYKYMKAGSSVHIPSARTGSLESVFVLLQTQSTQVCLSKCGGCKLVIYDNCFLQINHLWRKREHAAEAPSEGTVGQNVVPKEWRTPTLSVVVDYLTANCVCSFK